MSLTRNDLQAISDLIDQKLGPIDKRFDSVEKELKAVKKLAVKIDKTTTDLVDFLDKDVMKATRRVDRVENVLNLPPLVD